VPTKKEHSEQGIVFLALLGLIVAGIAVAAFLYVKEHSPKSANQAIDSAAKILDR
jgi:hypothetical protein